MKLIKNITLVLFALCLSLAGQAKEKQTDAKKTALATYTEIKNMPSLEEEKVKAALSGLSTSEKVKLVKITLKDIKANQSASTAEYILAILLPPIAVGLHTDWEFKPLLINVLLTILGWLPGVIHAFIVLGA